MKSKVESGPSQFNVPMFLKELDPAEIQRLFLSRARDAALALGVDLLEQEVREVCGLPFARKGTTLNHRGGSEQTSIVVNGAKYFVRRPRVRNSEGEVKLSTLEKLQSQDLLDEDLQKRMLLGISTRNYDSTMQGYADRFGISKSSVSRSFVRASKKDLDRINHEDLGSHRFVALLMDGLEVAERSVIAAVGITETCEKIPLGLIEGNTENSTIVKDLLTSILERNFTLHCTKILVILDGSKALKKAVRDIFGDRACVQRCWIHKLRNLKSYVPENNHSQLHWRMKKLMGLTLHGEALRELESFSAWLSEVSVEAESSMREAGKDLLTVIELGLPLSLRKSLSTTNIIESLFSVVRDKSNRVKNWKSGKRQITRWIASSLIAHQKKMRRIRGHREIEKLVHALGGIDFEKRSA